MVEPMQCPVCGSKQIERRQLRGRLCIQEGEEHTPIPGIRTYNCEKGHIFMVADDASLAAGSS